MALPTTSITADFTFSNSDEVVGATLSLTLSSSTIDAGTGDILIPEQVSAPTDANGVISAELWPNTRGRSPTTYSAILQLDGEPRPLWSVKNLVIPETAAVLDLADLIDQQDLTPLTVLYLTQTELDAEVASDPDFMLGKFIYVMEAP